MALENAFIRRVVLLGTLVAVEGLAAAQTPSPALLIVNTGKGENALQIADPLSMKVVATVPILGGGSGNPHEVAVSADGKLAFVTVDTEGGQADFLSVIDLAARKELRHVDIGPSSKPHGIASAGGKVYYTADNYGLVGRYDPASDRIDWMQGTGQARTHELVISKDTNRIFTSNTHQDSVTALVKGEVPTGFVQIGGDSFPPWNVTQIPVGDGPDGIAMSPDEKEVWVVTRLDHSVSIIDVATKKVSQTLNLKTKDPQTLKFTPDGKRVIIPDFRSADVLVLDAATRKEIKRINLGDQVYFPPKVPRFPPEQTHGILMSPDGSHAYVVIMGSNNIAILDLKTLEWTGRISTGGRPEGIAWAETR